MQSIFWNSETFQITQTCFTASLQPSLSIYSFKCIARKSKLKCFFEFAGMFKAEVLKPGGWYKGE